MRERDRNLPTDEPDPLDLEVQSHDALTPRGGFMARPGLKSPPRHAVVVRLGDAPATEEIPRARDSLPPPPPGLEVAPDSLPTPDRLPTLEVAPDSQKDKLTLRAIESVPPPSDMPVVASIRPQQSPARANRSSSAVVLLAAAAGIVLGLASVAYTRLSDDDAASPAAASPGPEMQELPAVPRVETAIASAAPRSHVVPLASENPPGADKPAEARPRAPRQDSAQRRSIF